ncbi:MAG: uncharacterized protein JWO94_2642 [Verrucomicrobiaceae bacterium]|nr:uncharacterized protein [Verrucomicrobiaceae bacterium]
MLNIFKTILAKIGIKTPEAAPAAAPAATPPAAEVPAEEEDELPAADADATDEEDADEASDEETDDSDEEEEESDDEDSDEEEDEETDEEEVEEVDVVALMDAKLKASHEKGLDWRHSIVDLLKLLDIDSSLKSRQALAGELGYTGSTSDTATMNVWLIKEVLTQVASHGGNIPANLTH